MAKIQCAIESKDNRLLYSPRSPNLVDSLVDLSVTYAGHESVSKLLDILRH